MLGVFIRNREKAGVEFSSDLALVWGMRFLLGGMLLLPFVTSLLAFLHNSHLIGGMPLHLGLTAISVVLFSFAEDLFRDYNSYQTDSLKPVSWHKRILLLPVLVFWVVGCVFLSPLFYSALTILLVIFYRLCLYFRKTPEPSGKKKKRRK
jgi:ABC-type Fe3+-siderophore transport system permease subunit